jgi:hypothetical protein
MHFLDMRQMPTRASLEMMAGKIYAMLSELTTLSQVAT